MLTDILMIAVGILTILWAKLLLPHQLRTAQRKMTPSGRARFDHVMGRSGMKTILAVPGVCGVMLVLAGAALWLSN
jgi:hypothetical protein